jgi:hypothetical protein
MNANEPRMRRRGYFLSDSGSGPDLSDSESAEGLFTFRPARPRRAHKAATGAGPRHRATVSSPHHSNDKHAHGVRSAIATGTRRP